MSKTTPTTAATARMAQTDVPALDKRHNAKQGKRLPQESEPLVLSDAEVLQGGDAIVPVADTAGGASSAPIVLAQVDAATAGTATGAASAAETAVASSAASTSLGAMMGAFGSGWLGGVAALGGLALANHLNGNGAQASAVSGVAIDGYLSGASVFLVKPDGTKIDTGIRTDAQGKFTIQNPNNYVLQIEGGTNTDTGLANQVVLKAPAASSGSIVVTPLTTTIQAMMDNDTHLTASQAADKLKTALGITGSDNLLTLDPIATQNLVVQKANVQIATSLSLVTDANEADAVLSSLANAINASTTALDLNTTLVTTLQSQTTLDNTTLSAISAKLTTLVTASSIDSLGAAQAEAMANDAPTIAGLSSPAQVVPVGQATVLNRITVADANGDNLSVTLTASNGVIGGLSDADLDTAGIQITGTATHINAQLASASFTAAQAGAASIGISVSDGQAAAVTASYALTGNDAPTIAGVPGAAQTVTVGQAAALADFSVADANGDNLTVTLVASNGSINGLTDADLNTAGIQLTGTATQINTQLTNAGFTAAQAGAASIGISVSDGQAAAVTASYALTAQAVASGSVVAGPVLASNDLVVSLYQADGVTQIGTTTVDANGYYTAALGGYTGMVIAKVSSAGTGVNDYMDEATGLPQDLSAVLTAVGVATVSGLSLCINPLTTIAAQVAGLQADGSGALSDEQAVAAAYTQVAAAFGIGDSLTAPNSLIPLVDVSGQANAGADAYGQVLAVLSGMDARDPGGMLATITALAADLSDDGALSASHKFDLVLAAQGLGSLSSGLATAIVQLTRIGSVDILDAADALPSSDWSADEFAEALSHVLEIGIDANDLDAVIASMQAAASAATEVLDVPVLALAAGQYVATSFGPWLNIAESKGTVSLSAHGLGVAAGDQVTVTINDPAAADSLGEWYQPTVLDLVVGQDGHTVLLPERELWNDLWGEGRVTVTVASATGASVSGAFMADLYDPGSMGRWSLDVVSTGGWWGFTNGSAGSITVWEPSDWGQTDHWQYRLGVGGAWVDGGAFVDGQATLVLPEGAYGTSDDNKIYLRTYDDAGNVTATATSNQQFVVDRTAPTLAVVTVDALHGTAASSELGTVVLINDGVWNPAMTDTPLVAVLDDAINDHQAVANNVYDDSVRNQPLDLSSTGLQYGHYHYYAVDQAGNVAASSVTVDVDNQAPVVSDNPIADQVIYRTQSLSLDGASGFTAYGNDALTYTATANGQALPDWLTLNAATGLLEATPQDMAAHLMDSPLTIHLTATDSAGLTVKSVSDDFTLSYVDQVPNDPPQLEMSWGSWNLSVGSDERINGYAWDTDAGDTLTYSLTVGNEEPAPAWLSIVPRADGNFDLWANSPTLADYAPLGGNPLPVTVTVTDSQGATASQTINVTVNNDVYYTGQTATSFELTVSADALSGSAVVGDTHYDLAHYQAFYGNGSVTGLTDTAHLTLDNGSGSALDSGNAPYVDLGNFGTVNVDVTSHTELDGLGTWGVTGNGQYASQAVNIQADADLVLGWLDTADDADTTLHMAGSHNVTINSLDGNWDPSLAFTLDASQLTGQLSVAEIWGSSATVIGGSGNDTLNASGVRQQAALSGGAGADTLTGSVGADTFDLGAADHAIDTVVYTGAGQTASNVDTSNTAAVSTTGMDVIEHAERLGFRMGDQIQLWAGVLTGPVSVSHDFLTDANINQLAIVQGLETGGVFQQGTDVTATDCIVQWTDGTSIYSVLYKNLGVDALTLRADVAHQVLNLAFELVPIDASVGSTFDVSSNGGTEFVQDTTGSPQDLGFFAPGSYTIAGGDGANDTLSLNTAGLNVTATHVETIYTQGGDATVNLLMDGASANSLDVGGYVEHLNLDLLQDWSLDSLSDWQGDSASQQTVNIHLRNDATLTFTESGYNYNIDTNDSGATTMNITGAGHIVGMRWDADYSGGGNAAVASTLDAHTLNGSIDVTVAWADSGVNIYGSTGGDTIVASDSDDLIVGGQGADTLTGRAGVNTFLFQAGDTGADTGTADHITDLKADDRIDLSGISSAMNLQTTPATDLSGAGLSLDASKAEAWVAYDSVNGLDYLVYQTSVGSAHTEMIEIGSWTNNGTTPLGWTMNQGVITIV